VQIGEHDLVGKLIFTWIRRIALLSDLDCEIANAHAQCQFGCSLCSLRRSFGQSFSRENQSIKGQVNQLSRYCFARKPSTFLRLDLLFQLNNWCFNLVHTYYLYQQRLTVHLLNLYKNNTGEFGVNKYRKAQQSDCQNVVIDVRWYSDSRHVLNDWLSVVGPTELASSNIITEQISKTTTATKNDILNLLGNSAVTEITWQTCR